MNINNKFIEKLEHKNRIKNILNDDLSDKLLSNKVKKPSINSLLSTRPELKENINKIKMKYGYSENHLEQQNLHHQISQLKNKYIKDNTNKYKINNVNKISYINENQNNLNKEFQKSHKNKNHSLDIEKIKNRTLPSNINYEKERISFCLSNGPQTNNNINNISNLSDNIEMDKKRKSIDNYQKYLKNKRNEYNKIEQKINEILNDKEFIPEKKQKFSSIYPISKRINLLTDVKKEINIINKSDNNTNNSIFDQVSYDSYTTVGFNYIKPKIHRISIYEDSSNRIIDTKNSNSNNEISKNNKLDKPIFIRTFHKPNVNILDFQNYCQEKKE